MISLIGPPSLGSKKVTPTPYGWVPAASSRRPRRSPSSADDRTSSKRNTIGPQVRPFVTSTPHHPALQREMSSIRLRFWATQRPASSGGAVGIVSASAMPATQNAAIIVAVNGAARMSERMIRRSGSRFAEKIMRHLRVGARSDAKPGPTFADRAPSVASGRRRAPSVAAVVPALTFFLLVLPAALVAIALGAGLRPLPYEL